MLVDSLQPVAVRGLVGNLLDAPGFDAETTDLWFIVSFVVHLRATYLTSTYSHSVLVSFSSSPSDQFTVRVKEEHKSSTSFSSPATLRIHSLEFFSSLVVFS